MSKPVKHWPDGTPKIPRVGPIRTRREREAAYHLDVRLQAYRAYCQRRKIKNETPF